MCSPKYVFNFSIVSSTQSGLRKYISLSDQAINSASSGKFLIAKLIKFSFTHKTFLSLNFKCLNILSE